ncbi:hypothetical protein PV325_009243 [Microctonus aethiopoides]|nr:hypothetical protein PV325_009243 [Microctonus aethiopoides]
MRSVSGESIHCRNTCLIRIPYTIHGYRTSPTSGEVLKFVLRNGLNSDEDIVIRITLAYPNPDRTMLRLP